MAPACATFIPYVYFRWTCLRAHLTLCFSCAYVCEQNFSSCAHIWVREVCGVPPPFGPNQTIPPPLISNHTPLNIKSYHPNNNLWATGFLLSATTGFLLSATTGFLQSATDFLQSATDFLQSATPLLYKEPNSLTHPDIACCLRLVLTTCLERRFTCYNKTSKTQVAEFLTSQDTKSKWHLNTSSETTSRRPELLSSYPAAIQYNPHTSSVV